MTDVTYIISLTVRDAPGVLVRVAQIFARRGCNIRSINVGPSDEGQGWASMKIVVKNVYSIEQIAEQLEKLIDVNTVQVHKDELLEI